MTTHEGAPMPTHPEVVTLDPASNDDALRLAAAIRSVCDIDGRWDAAEILQALAAPTPLPEQPPMWTIVEVPHSGTSLVDQPYTPYSKWVRAYEDDEDASWVRLAGSAKYAETRTWPEVCALGTPEVLEPDSVKALREGYEREHRLSLGFAERASKAEDKAKEWEGKYDAHEVALDSVATFVFDLPDDNPARKQLGEILGMDLATEDEPAEPAPVEVTEPYVVGEKWRDRLGHVWRLAGDGWHMFEFSDGDLAFMKGPYTTEFLTSRNGPLTLVETGGQS